MSSTTVNSLFITHTPYHFYQSINLIKANGVETSAHIHFVGSQKILDTYLPLLNLLLPNTEVSFTTQSDHSSFYKLFTQLKAIKKIKSIISCDFPTNLYVFHDGRPDTQFSMQYLKRVKPAAKINYVEDGTALYVLDRSIKNMAVKKKRILQPLINFILGVNYKPLAAHGMSDLLQSFYLTWPELIEDITVNKNALPKIQYKKVFINYCQIIEQAFKISAINQPAVLFYLEPSFSGDADMEYLSILRVYVQAILASGKNVYFKLHPSDDISFYLKAGFTKEFFLPQELASEFLLEAFHDSFEQIIGTKSTALLTAAWRFPKKQVFYINKFTPIFYKKLFDNTQVIRPY